MQKIVINKCYGGFGLSKVAIERYCKIVGVDPGSWDSKWDYYTNFDWDSISRDDANLVALVEELGTAANGAHAKLSVVDIPDDVEWLICEHEGVEHIAEKHRTWS